MALTHEFKISRISLYELLYCYFPCVRIIEDRGRLANGVLHLSVTHRKTASVTPVTPPPSNLANSWTQVWVFMVHINLIIQKSFINQHNVRYRPEVRISGFHINVKRPGDPSSNLGNGNIVF